MFVHSDHTITARLLLTLNCIDI